MNVAVSAHRLAVAVLFPRNVSGFMIRQCCVLCVICMAGAAAVGCGGSFNPVSGKVTFSDGSPVTTGRIVFMSPSGSARGNIGTDGTYRIGSMKPGDGAAVGTYSVAITAAISDVSHDQLPPTSAAEAKSYRDERAVTWLVDQKYGTPKTSGLTAVVTRGTNIINFSVERPIADSVRP